MKKFSKVISTASAFMMALAMLAGCTDAASSTQTESSGTQTEGSAEAVFKIGAIGPLTGDNAAYGNAVCNAAELAVEEINAAGGINGYKVEYKKEDDETNAEKSVNAYNALKDWGMQILVGSTTSGCSIAVSENTKADNMFQLTPSGSAVDCVKYDNAFRVCFSDPNQGIASAQYISDNNLAKKVGIIYDSSDIYSDGIYQKFVQESEGKNYEIVSAEAFTSDSATDFSVQLQKAKDAGADLVFLPIYYKSAALILTQANTMGYSPIFFGVDGLDGILTVANFDVSLAEGVMLLTPFAADATDDLTVNFVSKYKEKYGEVPNQFAADAYDAVYIIKNAIEKKNVTPDMSVSDICEAIKGAMTEIEVAGVTSSKMTWDASGEPNKEPRAVVIKNGTYVSAQ
ncbi:ABC transporter substrate-binding protein [Butyrivibrio sp. INlla14]|uniref:ABC transporter substrate-binding protein n=1 Tax=Butyrivibrio sp. INlla14 TaxID=1520808 RepID=UPI00087746FA|nr:ABC transporter substrate-binding protein [Butyrivibrio sp. INlla14]SCY40079.1 branched-chain amino acid transport system substrate-binding protein [Butyrivibrio sp. INlla14]